MVLSIEGQLDIFSADESGNDVHEWSGFVTKIPGFLAGEKVYRVVHEYDDEFRFNVTETITFVFIKPIFFILFDNFIGLLFCCG